MNKDKAKLIALLLGTFGVWVAAAVHWSDLLQPLSIGGLLGNLSLVIAAAFGVSLSLKGGAE